MASRRIAGPYAAISNELVFNLNTPDGTERDRPWDPSAEFGLITAQVTGLGVGTWAVDVRGPAGEWFEVATGIANDAVWRSTTGTVDWSAFPEYRFRFATGAGRLSLWGDEQGYR